MQSNSINGIGALNSIVSMLNSRAKSFNIQQTQQSSVITSISKMRELTMKGDDNGTINTANTGECFKISSTSFTKQECFSWAHNSVGNIIDNISGTYKDVQLIERYEDLLQDDSYSDEMREQFQKSLDYYKQSAINVVKTNTQLINSMFTGYWGRFASSECTSKGELITDLTSSAQADKLGLTVLSKESTSADFFAAMDKALEVLNPLNDRLADEYKSITGNTMPVYDAWNTNGRLSTYEIEKYDAMNQAMINPAYVFKYYDSLEGIAPTGEKYSLDINKLLNNQYSREEIQSHIDEIREWSLKSDSERPVIENVFQTYKEFKGEAVNDLRIYTSDQRIVDSRFVTNA